MELIVIAGPNGAGKSTGAAYWVPPSIPFINADEIAMEFDESDSGTRDVRASRIMLQRIDELARQGSDFAVETTLASLSLAPRITRMKANGYRFRLHFLWLPSADIAVQRVAERVRKGGHHIPELTIRRRYRAGLRNLFRLYLPIADRWRVFDNSGTNGPELIARGSLHVLNIESWERVRKEGQDA